MSTAIDLHPLGRAFGAELCLGCHSLHMSFCDQEPGDRDWKQFKQDTQPNLYFVDCGGDSGWGSDNGAVLALRRAVVQAERAEQLEWSAKPRSLVLVHNESQSAAEKES